VTLRRRALTVLSFGFAIVVAMATSGTPPASAHPLGNFTVNRYSGIVLSPGRVGVLYVLDMAEIPTFQERPQIDANNDGSESAGEVQAYASGKAATLLNGVTLAVDGRGVALRLTGSVVRFLPGQAGLATLRLEARFEGRIAAAGSATYRDWNYAGRIGWKEITVRSEAGVAVDGASVPGISDSRELLAYPKDLLSSPLSVTSATFRFHPGDPAALAASAATGSTVTGAPVASGGSFAALVRWRLTPLVVALSLALAFLFGCLHALGPGHGKTITAAYLVGAGARVRHAMTVGVAVALMHTSSVLALGLVLFVLARTFPVEHVYPWLTLLTGVVALTLGTGLFLTRLMARRRHLGVVHGHRHDHGEDHDHVQAGDHDHSHPWDRPAAGRNLIALAVAGGILPSPTAFVVLTGSISAHRIGYGLGLIAAFSLGLATALILIGLLALRARSLVAAHLRGRWAALVPLGSALVIVGFGLFFAARGATQLA